MKHCKMKVALKNAILTLFIGVTAAICCILGLSFLNFEESVQTASAATDFASAWNAAVEASSTENPQTFTLTDDWIAPENSAEGFGTGEGFSNGRIYVPAGKSVILDLNGFTIDRNYTAFGTYGNVISVAGTLVLNDSFYGETGKITGGYNSSSTGGGISVSGTFTMNGGSICSNVARGSGAGGGGVYISSMGTFTMNGGSICSNKVDTGGAYGGGVFSYGTFIMCGGEISDNTASYGGGVVLKTDSTFTMNGGSISGNTATSYGGGVYTYLTSTTDRVDITITGGKISDNTASYGGGICLNCFYRNYAFITITGGEISGNHASVAGGGIYFDSGDGCVTVSDSPNIYGNYLNSTQCDFSTNYSAKINVAGELSTTAKIGIYDTGVATTGYKATCGTADPSNNFISSQGYSVSLYNGSNTDLQGEVVIGTPLTVSQPTWENGTNTAKVYTYNGTAQGSAYNSIANVTLTATSGATFNETENTFTATEVNCSNISDTRSSSAIYYRLTFKPDAGYYWEDGLGHSAKYLTIYIIPKRVDLSWENTTAEYDGNEHLPTATIADGALIGSDTCGITISGAATEIGTHTAKAIPTNKNYCFGSISSGTYYSVYYYTTTTFTITQPALTDSTTGYSGTYDGEEHGITVSVTGFNEGDSLSDGTIKYGTEEGVYELDTCPTLTNVGTLTVYYQVTFDNYGTVTGSKTVTIDSATLTDTTTGYNGAYDGAAHGITVSATGFIEGESLSDGTIKYGTEEGEYELDTCPTQTNAGTLTVYYEVTFDNYETINGSITVTVTQRDISNVTVTVTGEYEENGTEIIPTFTVTDGEIAITEDDYTVSYSDNVNAGTATITLTGAGNYTGTKTQTFEITSAPEPEEPDEPDVPEEPTPETPDKTDDKEPSKGLSTVSIVIIVIVALVVVAAIAASLAVLFKKRKDE